MSRKMDGPVQTQTPVEAGNKHRDAVARNKPFSRRRIFVQTDRGSVLGVELERGDNVNSVKRRIQLELNVPTEESSLTYGDLVIKNDLSRIRNDSPLLLTRNFMHRSSSTPCLSPTGKDVHKEDRSGPIAILACPSKCLQTKKLVKDVVKAIKSGIEPVLVSSGLGGSYYFRNIRGESVAIVKPTDEEPFAPNNPKGYVGKALGQPGLKRSVRVGETGFREVAAYLLDYDHFANVPPTVLVKVTHSVFHANEVNGNSKKSCDSKPKLLSKIASFQQFIPHDYDASDHGTSRFPVAAIHRIGILDVRTFNTDRHAGNLLVRNLNDGIGNFGDSIELIPIDHGLCLPETLEDPYFEWIYWPQASIPFSEDELEYIAKLDPKKDIEMLQMELPMIREACLRVLVVCTIFLKEAAKFGLCLSEIGQMMSREFRGKEEEPSDLEVVCMEARRLVEEREPITFELGIGEDFQFDSDSREDGSSLSKTSPYHNLGLSIHDRKNPFSKLHSMEEEGEDNLFDADEGSFSSANHDPILPVFRKGLSFSTKSLHFPSGGLKGLKLNSRNNCNVSLPKSGNRRSAEEQMPSSSSFVALADMGEEEWAAFLETFQELLLAAFQRPKCDVLGQRLATSCQF